MFGECISGLEIDKEDVHDRKKWRINVMKRTSNPRKTVYNNNIITNYATAKWNVHIAHASLTKEMRTLTETTELYPDGKLACCNPTLTEEKYLHFSNNVSL